MSTKISADDLYRFQAISGCAISPDGKYIAFSLHRVDRESEKKFANIWVVPTDEPINGQSAQQFTFGDQRDVQPQWSPDGSQIAFLSNQQSAGQSQITVIPFGGGAPRPVTNLRGRFVSLRWSPDGARFVCAFRKQDPAVIEREADERKKRLGIVARHITRIHYKADGAGYLPQEFVHIWTVDAQTGEATQHTDGDMYNELEPAWSPDGESIVFLSNRSDDPDFHPGAVELFVMLVGDGTKGEIPESTWQKLKTPLGVKAAPTFSPDGQQIAYYGRDGEGDSWKNMQLWTTPVDGLDMARSLTAHIDQHVGNVSLNDLGGAEMMAPCWSNDGQRIFFQTTHRGNSLLNEISTTMPQADIQPVIHEEGVVGAYSLDDAQSTVAYFFATWASPGQLWVRDLVGGSASQVTSFNEEWINAMELGEVEEVWFRGGAYNELQGWILKPPGFNPAQKYPSILEIHGGPLAQYANCFMLEFYYLAAQGYVVYFCNPRGGRGYGEVHAKAMVNDMGGPDYDDVMAWIDFVEQKPYIDRTRMGVTGGSYGGYMTNFLIGRTNRFQAAVTQRCISNRISDFGSKYTNWQRQFVFGGESPWENVENYWRQSPLKYIGGATTPTLIIHSEQDMMCSLEQAEQLYVALKVLGVDTELVIFPEESHNLSRAGRTDRRVERLRHILRWFERYLGGGE